MSSLQLPPYVLEHIFDSLKLNSKLLNYHRRTARFVYVRERSPKLTLNFIHQVIEERTHAQNITINVHFGPRSASKLFEEIKGGRERFSMFAWKLYEMKVLGNHVINHLFFACRQIVFGILVHLIEFVR